MDEMTQSINEIVNTVTRVQEIAHENKEHIDELSDEIGRFRVE
jgi:methyl-accepting chemotaxis protein